MLGFQYTNSYLVVDINKKILIVSSNRTDAFLQASEENVAISREFSILGELDPRTNIGGFRKIDCRRPTWMLPVALELANNEDLLIAANLVVRWENVDTITRILDVETDELLAPEGIELYNKVNNETVLDKDIQHKDLEDYVLLDSGAYTLALRTYAQGSNGIVYGQDQVLGFINLVDQPEAPTTTTTTTEETTTTTTTEELEP